MAKRTEPNSDTNTNDMPIILKPDMYDVSDTMNRASLGHRANHDDSDDDSSDEDDVLGEESLSNYASLEEVNDDESNLLLRDLDCSEGVDIKSLEMSPETNAKFQALLDAAGIGQFPSHDGRPLADPEVIRQLSNSVSCALDEAAAALGKLGDPDMIDDVTRGSTNTVAVGHSNGPTVGCTPTTLAQACVEGNLALVKQMLESGARADEVTQDGETPLTMAVTAGFTEIVDILLKSGANPNLRGSKAECTALMEAASAGYVEIVYMLLQHGADVNVVSSTGNTALHYACCGGHEECLIVLLDNHADVEVQNENGHTALMEAASGGHVNLARHLLKHGAGINTHSTEFKESALTLACYKGHLEMVKFLLDSGADHEHKTDEMHTALMEAAMDGHVEVARLLLAHGAHVNMPADSFESPLTLAACGGHTELASLLLGHGADLEEVNDEGYTPLMEAAREGHDEMVALLLAHGADVNAQTQETQETALTLAACGGFVEVAELLLRCDADIELGSSTPLMEAAQEGHVELVKRLLAHGAKVNAETVTGDTALHYACENDHEDVCKILLDQGADLEHCSEGGRTPLMKAARAGKLRCVRLFISRCTNVNRATTNNEFTALSLACGNGHLMVVDCLLKAGADPKLNLRDGNTLLIEAAKGGHTDVTRLLLDFPHIDAETVQAQSVQAAAAAQVSSGSTVTANAACSPGTPGAIVSGPSSGSVADRLPAEGLPSIVPPPPPNTGSVPSILDGSGGTAKVAPPPLLPSSAAAAAASASTGIRPAPQRASAAYGQTYSSFSPQSPHASLSVSANPTAALVDEPWELPPAAGGAGGAASAAAVLDSLPGDITSDYNLLEDFRNPDKLDELLTRFMKIQEAATSAAAASAGGRRNQKSSESECSNVSALHPPSHIVTAGHLQQQQPSVSGSSRGSGKSSSGSPASLPTPSLPPNPPLDPGNLGPGASKEKLTAIFERTQRIFNNPESTLPTVSPLQQKKWSVAAPSVVANPMAKSAVGLSSGPLAQALSALQPTQPQQLQQQLQQLQQQQMPQPVPLPLPLHTGDIPALSSAENSVSSTTSSVAPYSTPVQPPPPPMTTSQLQQLEQQLLQTRQQLGEPPTDGAVDNLPNSFPGASTAVSTVLAPTSISSPTTLSTNVVAGNGVGLVPMSSVNNTAIPAGSCVNSNGSVATSSSTPCYSPHSPCYPPQSPHHFVHGESSIDINAFTESTAETALTLASQGGYEDLVRLLLERGAYIEHRDNKGYTPLINAAINGHREVVRLLLDRQADMEAQSDRTKDTALSLACSGGRYEVAELLLQRHANKEHRNVSDYTPLSLAASGGYVNIINLLLKHCAEINSRTGSKLGISPLMLAAMNGHKEAVRVLLDSGSDINAMIETNRNTALTLACFQGRHEVVNLLLERKALIEHRAKTGLTPLMEAASGGYVEVGRVLLEKGAEVNALPVPTSRDTALTIAADKGHTKFVQLLLEHGAHVEVKNKKGCSPLWLACNGGHLEVVQKLVQHSADVNSMDNRKTSCLMAAFRKGHLKVVKFLVKHVTQFPPDNTCLRYIQTIADKELSKKCNTCMDIIVTAKDRQAAEANKNANNLLQELDNEKELVAKKQAALAKKREKKRQKRIKARERERERVERPGDDDDDDVGSTIGGGLSSVAARGQSGFDTDDLESDVLENALNDSATAGERESGDGGEMDEEAGGKRYKPSAQSSSEVQVESLWSRLSPLPPTEPKGGSELKLKKSSKMSGQSYRSVASARKGTTVASSNTSSSPGSTRPRRTPPPLDVPMGTPTATTAGTTGHNLTSSVVVSGGRQPRHNSNNNNASTSGDSVHPKLNSSMTALEKKAAMARNKKSGKKASSPSSVVSSQQVSNPMVTTTISSAVSSRRKRGDQLQEKTPSRSPPPPPPPPPPTSTITTTTPAWTSGHPPSYSAAVAASSPSQPNGDLPNKTSTWPVTQPTVLLSVSVAPITSSSSPAVSAPQISPTTTTSNQLLVSAASDQTEFYSDIYTDATVDEAEGSPGSLVSSPLASPGGPWITAGGRNSTQHSHGGGGGGNTGATAGSAVGTAEHEWTTVAKRKISMPVSRREIGKVIGQSGTTINTIRQQSGAHIDIDNKESENGERQVHIRGPVDAVNRAKTMIEHLVSGKPLAQLLSMPSSSTQSAVPLMSGVSTAGGGSRKGSSTKTTGATGTIAHTSASAAVKGSKPLPIRQQTTRGGTVIIPTGSGPTTTRAGARKANAPEAYVTPAPAPSYSAWSGPGIASNETSHVEMNFASVAAAGVVRPVATTPSCATNVTVTQSIPVKSANAPKMAGFPTLSESLSLSSSSGIMSTNDLPSQSSSQQLNVVVTCQAVVPSTITSTSTPTSVKAVSPTTVRVSGQPSRDPISLKASVSPDLSETTRPSLAPTQISSEPRFHSGTAISESGGTVVPPPVQPILPQAPATSAPSTTSSSTKTTEFNRAPGSHRPKPPVVSTSTTTTTTITTISSEPTGDLTSEGQTLSMPTSLNLLTPPVPGTSSTMTSTHASSSRASPSSSPYPTASTTPVSSSSQVTSYPTPSTPHPPGSPPTSRNAPSPPAPIDSRPSQSLVAVVAPSITPTAMATASTSVTLSNLTVSSASCTTMSPINATHGPPVSATPSMLSSAVQSTSVPAPIAPPISYPPNLASMMTPPGLVSNATNEMGMTLPRISSLNPGANTFEPRAPSSIPPNIVPGTPQMLQSGHTTQQQMPNAMRPPPMAPNFMTQQQHILAMEAALRISTGSNGNTTGFSGTGSDPASIMGVRGHNDVQLAAAASRAMFSNLSSSMNRNSSYYVNNAGTIGSGMINNPNLFGGTQQHHHQQQQHGNLIGNSSMNRNSGNLATVQHMYQHSQQPLGTAGCSDSGVNSPQQLLMLTSDCLYNANSSNVDMPNMGNSGNCPVDSHDSSYPFLLGNNSQAPFGTHGAPNFNSGQELMNFMTNGLNSVNSRGSGAGNLTRPIGAERPIATANSNMKSSNWTNMPQMPGNGSGSNSIYGNPAQQTNNLMTPQMNPGGATSTASGGGTAATHYNWGNTSSWAVSGSSGGSGVPPTHLTGAPGAGGTGGGWPGSSNNMSSIQMSSIPSAAALQSGWPSGGGGGEWPQTGGPQQTPQRSQPQQQPSSHHLTDQ